LFGIISDVKTIATHFSGGWGGGRQSSSTTYSNSFSRKTTGSGSLIAALSKPRESSDEYGVRTFNPGHDAYQDA